MNGITSPYWTDRLVTDTVNVSGLMRGQEAMKTTLINVNGASAHRLSRRNAKGTVNIVVPMVIGALTLAAVGIIPRVEQQMELNRVHHELTIATPKVSAVKAQLGASDQALILPGDLQPIQNIPIYARANGYLSQRLVDIGDNVKAGQLLAVIDTPELDQQV